MSGELDDKDVFEIQDYTTASDWECFTAAIEELIHNWQLNATEGFGIEESVELPKSESTEKSEVVKFADYEFTVNYHVMKGEADHSEFNIDSVKGDNDSSQNLSLPSYLKDMLSFDNDFPNKVHCLVRWFGVCEFITVAPDPSRPPLSPSKVRVLLSSLSLAANNTNCEIPMFVQLGDGREKIFVGVGVGSDLRTDFDVACVSSPPPQCTHLSGLLDLFKSKIGTGLSSEPVMVSIRFTYVLTNWLHTQWSQEPPDLDAALSHVGYSGLGKLPFGSLVDPISELHLSTTWPCVNEYNLMDSDVQSDLNPSSAPIWSVRLGPANAALCLMTEYLSEFLESCQNRHSTVQILGPEFDPNLDDSADIANAFNRLTSSPISSLSPIKSSVRVQNPRRTSSGPLSEEMISLFLNFLFPDADSDHAQLAPYDPSKFSQVPPWTPTVEGLPDCHPFSDVMGKMKSCSYDSFVWRLCICLCHASYSLGGLKAVAHLLYELYAELRFRWDNAILILGLKDDFPDMTSCIVNQKLQMLNCCIQRRIKREKLSNESKPSEDAEDEEQYFECDESMNLEPDSTQHLHSWDKPEGRLKRFGNARLLHWNDYLYVPITQDPAPYTEDSLEEQTGELLRMGTDASGSCMRAKLMSASLLSDMESFKAANPGSAMEDFVRWYSPRDWIEEDPGPGDKGASGHLSERMQTPGNLWMEVWENAKPVPSRRQKRLFDDTREAEKVLRWFTDKTPGQICLELLPVLMHAAVCRMAQEPILYTLSAVQDDSLPSAAHDDSLAAQLELLAKRLSRLSRQPPNIQQYLSIQYHIETIERTMARALSLRKKLLGHCEISPVSLKWKMDGAVPQSDSEVALENEMFDKESCTSTYQPISSTRCPESLSPLESLVTQLLHRAEVYLDGGSNGLQANIIKKLFTDAKNFVFVEDDPPEKKEKLEVSDVDLGLPEGREYILRTWAPFPMDHSRPTPHRLYAVIQRNSFRMAGAVTQDNLFC